MADSEVTVHVVLGMNAAQPLANAIQLIDRIQGDQDYHPDFDKLRECIELASEFIDTRQSCS
jgi:hypothetical protein